MSPGSSGLTEFEPLGRMTGGQPDRPGAVIDRPMPPARRGSRPPRSGAPSPAAGVPCCSYAAICSAPVVAVDLDIFLGEVAGPDGGLAATEPDIGADRDVLAASCRPRSPLPNRPGRARPGAATRMSPNQIDSRSRSAGSPALPTAMTTRPQLASSPAIAVLTSGELAIDSAMRLAERADLAPVTVTSTCLRAPSPSRTTCSASDFRTWSRPARNAPMRGVFDIGDAACAAFGCRAGGKQQQRVAGRGVAVDGYRVEGLCRCRRQQALQHAGGDRRVGRDEGQHGRHVRRDHAGALGDAVDGHLDVAEPDGRGRIFRIGVGGHDRLAGVRPAPGLAPWLPCLRADARSARHQAARR